MTGEISLKGKVMPVGGIREKVVAARRAGMKRVILPWDNRGDWDELPDFLKEGGVQVIFAREYEDIFRVAFPDVPFAPRA